MRVFQRCASKIAVVGLLCACSRPGSPPTARAEASTPAPRAAETAERALEAAPATQGAAIGAVEDLGLAVFRAVASRSAGNVVISPLLLRQSLGQVAAALSKGGEREVARALGVDGDLHAALAVERRRLGGGAASDVRFAARVFVGAELGSTREYDGVLSKYYDSASVLLASGGSSVRFRAMRERLAVDSRVDEPPLPAPVEGAFFAAGVLAIRTALDEPFPASNTKPSAFYVTRDDAISVPKMVAYRRTLRFRDRRGEHTVEIPFAGGRMVLLLVAPATLDDLRALEGALTRERIADIRQSLSSQFLVTLEIPKLRVGAGIELSDPLRGAGVTAPFEAGAYSFSRERGFGLSGVLHALSLCLDDAPSAQGTVAGAFEGHASGNFHRPFLAVVLDDASGEIVLLARITEPVTAQGTATCK